MALDPWRCHACGRRLADVALSAGSTVVCKCRCCNTVNVIRAVESQRPDGTATAREPMPIRPATVG